MHTRKLLISTAVVFAGLIGLRGMAQDASGDPCSMVSLPDVGPLLTLNQAEITLRPADPSDPYRMQCVWRAETSFGGSGELDIHRYTLNSHAEAIEDLRSSAPFDYKKRKPLVKTADPDDYVETTSDGEVLAVHGPYKVELNISGVTDAAMAHPTWEYRLQRTALLAAGSTIIPISGLAPDPVLPQPDSASKAAHEVARKIGFNMPWDFSIIALLLWLTVFIIGCVIYYLFFYLPGKRQKSLNEVELPGTATIDSISDTGVTIDHNPQIRYHCTVTPFTGEPYKASTTMLVNEIDRPLPVGTIMAVKIDQNNPQSFRFEHCFSFLSSVEAPCTLTESEPVPYAWTGFSGF